MAKYGKTYWGLQFLNALEHIDYSNRLPRGRSYASNGYVKSIVIEKNKIQAKVKGSMPQPYNIDIIVPEFSVKQKNDLLDAIQSNPAILASLLNRQLPNDLLNIAKGKGIEIFPKQWRDFNMHCSCPDSAVPCKHLAAVIYLIANEIDLNPFKVLELHGLDVLSELTKNNIDIEKNVTEKIESWNEYFSESPASSQPSINIDGLNELDFTVISEFNDKFLNLLSPNPPFYDRDFKPDLLTNIRFVSKHINRHSFDLQAKHVLIDIYNVINAAIIFSQNDKKYSVELSFEHESKRVSLLELFSVFNDSENFKISQTSDAIKVLYNYFLFAKKLIEQCAVIPQLASFNEHQYINWIPLLQDTSVRLQLDILNKYSSLINIINEDGKKVSYFTHTPNFALCLTSIFNTSIIKDILNQSRKINMYDDIPVLFFGEPAKLKEQNENVLNAIQLWLNKIHSHKRSFTPVLHVEEAYPCFNVSLFIKSVENNKIEAPVAFHLFKKKNKSLHLSVSKDLMQLQEHFAEFKTILNSNVMNIISYDSSTFADFLFKIIPVLNLLGVEILLPKSLKYIVKPALSLQAKTSKTISVKSYMDLMSILQFDWQVAVGDELMNENEFLRLVKGMDGIIKIKDNFIHADKEELDKLLKHLQNPQQLSRNQMLQVLFANEYNGAKIGISPELQAILDQFINTGAVSLPGGLDAVLRPYQLRGYEWLYKNSKIGFGSILADDMGLGKTLQTIVVLLKFKEEKILEKEKALIVMPTTLLTNWSKEIQKFAPSLTFHIYHGSKRDINEFTSQDILLTSYGIARSDAEILGKLKWQVLIIDEAQNIKNHTTDQQKQLNPFMQILISL